VIRRHQALEPRPAGGILGGIAGGIEDPPVASAPTAVRRTEDLVIGRSILALVTHGTAGASARKAACSLAESVDGWLTLAVPVEQPGWQSAFAALGGHALHPAVLDHLARTDLEEHLDAVPPHLKTHGLLLRGPIGAALLARATAVGHDVIVVPGCPRLLPLRAWLQVRSSVPVCVSSSSVQLHWHRERSKRC
jgi:hypothetical protein